MTILNFVNIVFIIIKQHVTKMKKCNSHLLRMGLVSLLFVLFGTITLSAQKVSGIVKDSEGTPLVGAAVLVKGTSNGTTTDGNGAFVLDNVSKGSTIF
jgi:TonB-dependent starch-binding outer membrane protein SusC